MAKYITTTSRNLDPSLTNYESVVFQTGKPLLDSELNLVQDISLVNSKPSGITSNKKDIFSDYVFNTTPNTLTLSAFDVRVKNKVIRIAYANDNTGSNKISLSSPPATQKSTTFVFLEIWKALVSPATLPNARLRIGDNVANGDTITIGTDTITCGVDFVLGADKYVTALNIANALSSLSNVVSSDSKGTDFIFLTLDTTVSISTTSLAITVTPATGESSGLNIPANNKIYIYGNVQSLTGAWLDDDIYDTTLNAESTKRIQYQYRFRTVNNFAVDTYQDGFSDTTNVKAQGTNGSPTSYSFSASSTDNGLWIAGSGNQASATALGTVDGYVYGLPICFVNRRNSGGFNPVNPNGALLSTHTGATENWLDLDPIVIPAGLSDRPDGLFADLIADVDITDMRKKVIDILDSEKLLTEQTHYLFDNNIKTVQRDGRNRFYIGNQITDGDRSTEPLVCDAIEYYGFTQPNTYGNLIGYADGLRRRFSSYPNVEKVIATITISDDDPTAFAYVDKVVGTFNWYENDEIILDFGNYYNAGFFNPVTDSFPTGTKIIDVLRAWHDDGHTTTAVSQNIQFKKIEFISATKVSLILDKNDFTVNGGLSTTSNYQMTGNTTDGDVGSPRNIFIELALCYPEGNGLSATPILLNPDSSVYPQGSVINESSLFFSEFEDGVLASFNDTNREIALEYVKKIQTIELVSKSATEILTPFKFYGDGITYFVQYEDQEVGAGYSDVLNTSDYNKSDASVLVNALTNAGQTLVSLKYYPLLANKARTMVYYRYLASQTTIPSGLTIDVEPIYISKSMYAIQTSKGSLSVSYPYPSASDMVGIHSDFDLDEWDLRANAQISISDFNIDAGMLSLNNFMPIDINTDLTFTSKTTDSQGNTIYEGGSGYLPVTYSSPFSSEVSHKNVLPLLCKAKSNTLYFRKGEVLLVLISRYAELDSENKITLGSNYTIASIYNTKNRLMME
jgi:hypothetical protein